MTKPASRLPRRITCIALTSLVLLSFQNCSQPLDTSDSSTASTASEYISFTSIPITTTVDLGGTIRMSATAVSLKNRTLYYQWKKDGVAITGGTLNTLVVSSSTKLNEGFYTIAVNDSIHYVETSPVWVQVGADSTTSGSIVIGLQPSTMTVAAGTTAYFEVIATDNLGKTLTYQWYYNGVALSGSTAAQLYVTNPTSTSKAGYYYVMISNGTTSIKSTTVSLVIAGDSTTCTSGTNYGGHCYVVYGTAATWPAAVSQCAATGGYLAKVTSYAESLFITNLAGQNVWIGASDSIIEGTYLWRDGTVMSYALWLSGQPDNSGDEDCVEIQSSAYWNDLSCSASRAYVCEIE